MRAVRRRLLAWLYHLARSRPVGMLLRWTVAHMSFLIPARRLRETPTLLAFQHPQPAYALHILILPRRAYASLLDLDPADSAFQRDLVETVQSLVREFGLQAGGYRLIVNGGAYQDVPLLHYHLISDRVNLPPAL